MELAGDSSSEQSEFSAVTHFIRAATIRSLKSLR